MDGTRQRLVDFALGLDFAGLAPGTVATAKALLFGMLGGVLAGFPAGPSRIARDLAMRMPQAEGATVIGTRTRTSADGAAFANAVTAREGGTRDGFTAAVFSAAEHGRAQGRELVVALAIAAAIDQALGSAPQGAAPILPANTGCIAVALAAGRLLRLSRDQMMQCASLAATLNIVLAGGGGGWPGLADGAAGRDGVFAALAAWQGMEGPMMPFEGKTGWSALVAGSHVTLDRLGRDDGSARAPDVADAEARFLERAGRTLGAARAAGIAGQISGLEELDDVSAITAAAVIA
jgi:2-methylcitrate dehydratase PrpD